MNADQETAAHDKAAGLFDASTLRQMEKDLAGRRLKFAKSPENRWCANRLAAIRRRLAILDRQKP